MTTPLRERVARALCGSGPDECQGLVCDKKPENCAWWKEWLVEADAALLAIGSPVETLERLVGDGFVVVPEKPDRAMLEALCRHRGLDPHSEPKDTLENLEAITLGTYVAAYEAMLAARPK